MIVSALLVDKQNKLEYPLKICLHAVVVAEMDVVEDIHLQPGAIGKILVLLLDGFTTISPGVNHTPSPHVIIIQQENINHVVHQNQLQNVIRTVFQDIPKPFLLINGMLNLSMVFHPK